MSVAVIGGGPAGVMAAAAAAYGGAQTVLFEKNDKLGRKLYLTGKGRCNLTNAADIEEFFAHIPRNGKFLYSALYGFDNAAVMALLEREGVPVKVERGARVFPASDKSSDVIRAFSRYLERSGAQVRLRSAVRRIEKTADGFVLHTEAGQEAFDAVILATGGLSYPTTGSTGDGYAFAAALGHTITPCKASLAPVETVEEWPRELQGLSLRNVTLRAYRGEKRIFEELGEMLFTHFGVTGPLVLSAVSRFADAPEGIRLSIDLKPGLSAELLDARVQRDLSENARRHFANALAALLPAKLIPVAVALSGVPAETPACEVTRAQRQAFCALLKNLSLQVRAVRPIEEAIITRGGVCVKEVNASTMESKLAPGLYFAGEMLDVDATTGGYNLQIAYATGVLAGRSAAAKGDV